MRFGNRLNYDSPIRWKRKNKLYLSQLRAQGISFQTNLFRYFAGEVFHDGEVTIRQCDLRSGLVVLQFRNVFALNQVAAKLRKKGQRRPKIDPEDFSTLVTFEGVTNLNVTFAKWRDVVYQCAEIGRRGHDYRLEVRLHGGNQVVGYLRLSFSKVSFENISTNLSKYLAGASASKVLFPSKRSMLSNII